MSNVTPFVFGALAGAFFAPIIGFAAFDWKLDAKAQTMASNAATAEVRKVVVPVCVAQFNADPQVDMHLAALKAMQYAHPRIEYVEKGGWARLAGQDAAVSGIARPCAEEIAKDF